MTNNINIKIPSIMYIPLKSILVFLSLFICLPDPGISLNVIDNKQIPSCSADTVSASEFGVKPNSFENASPGIRKAIAACKGKENITLILPGGRIDLWPEGAEKKTSIFPILQRMILCRRLKPSDFIWMILKN